MLYGMSGAEIFILQRWAQMVKLYAVPVTDDAPFADVAHQRREWGRAGGAFPVTEAEALFLKPLQAIAA